MLEKRLLRLEQGVPWPVVSPLVEGPGVEASVFGVYGVTGLAEEKVEFVVVEVWSGRSVDMFCSSSESLLLGRVTSGSCNSSAEPNSSDRADLLGELVLLPLSWFPCRFPMMPERNSAWLRMSEGGAIVVIESGYRVSTGMR